jgi:hypothetical protein
MSQQQAPAQAFIEMLTQGLDHKLRRANPRQAERYLTEAYGLADAHSRTDPLLRDYKKIAAYRLGHIKLQLAGGNRHQAVERVYLEEALRCFQETAAGGADTFGPMPWVMQLPTLKRLKDLPKTKQDAATFDAKIAEVLANAIRAASPDPRRPQASTRGHRDIALRRFDGQAFLPVAQGPMINLIELAIYFLGVDYDSLRGCRDADGDPCEGLIAGDSFVVVGHQSHAGGPSLRLPRQAVDDILQEAAQRGEHHLVFRLAPPSAGGPQIFATRSGAKFPRQMDVLHLIAIVCAGRASGGAELLRERLFGWKEDDVDAKGSSVGQLHVALSTARKSLANLLPPEARAANAPAITGEPQEGLHLGAGLRVLAGVDVALWRQDTGWIGNRH